MIQCRKWCNRKDSACCGDSDFVMADKTVTEETEATHKITAPR